MSLKIALLASGRGSNVRAILDAIENGTLDAQVQCLIANVEGAPVLEIGQQAGLPTVCIPHKGLSREDHEARMLSELSRHEIDYVVLAGYMRLMTPSFLAPFKTDTHYRIVNIHPSLLPAFPGTQAYDDAFHYGVKVSGVTVHFVDEAMDNGPILLQRTFERRDDDTLETFKARGLALEHQLYPEALQLLAQNVLRFHTPPGASRSYIEVPSHVPC